MRPLTRRLPAATRLDFAAPTDGQILSLSTPSGALETPGQRGAAGCVSAVKPKGVAARARVVTRVASKCLEQLPCKRP